MRFTHELRVFRTYHLALLLVCMRRSLARRFVMLTDFEVLKFKRQD